MFVSVIIPVRNEEKRIKVCLDRVFLQTHPKEKMEVLVVDGMSQDKTREIARHFPVRVLDNPKGQRASGLNIGIKSAKGEIILRIDARTVISKDYVEKCVKTLLETGADNVGGVQAPLINEKIDLTQKAIGLAATHPFGAGDAQFRLGKKSGEADSVYLGCFRKSIFDKVGLFDEESAAITEDSDINYRIKKAGGKVYLNKDIVAYYIPRDNLMDLWRLYFRYGGVRAGFFFKHRVLRGRHLMPLVFVLSLAALSLLSFISPVFLVAFIFLVGFYLLADMFAGMSLAVRHKDPRIFAPLMIVFPCMHFSWALGFMRRMAQRPKSGTYWGY